MTAQQKLNKCTRYIIIGFIAIGVFGFMMFWGAYWYAGAAFIIALICNRAGRAALDESRRLFKEEMERDDGSH